MSEQPMTFTDDGLNLIKSFEGCSLVAYQDQGGVWTIGFGHTSPDLKEGMTWTSDQACEALEADLAFTKARVAWLIKVPVNDNQYSACVCLAFNIGTGAFAKSTLLAMLNFERFPEAAEQFLVWDKISGVPNAGLLRRRASERELFLKV